MKKDADLALQKLTAAVDKFRIACVKTAKTQDEVDRDGTIQRFEFTFELLWKAIKIVLREKGVEAKNPRDCFQEAFRNGWFVDERLFLDMLDDRNLTSHVYSEPKVKEVFARVSGRYLGAIEQLLKVLQGLVASL